MNYPSRSKQQGRLFWLTSLFVIALLVLAACQSEEIPVTGETPSPAPLQEATATTAPVPTATAEMAAVEEAEINVASDPELGEILVGSGGMTLYMFTRDEPNKSNCSGDCLVNWPPLLTEGDPVLGAGVDASLVDSAQMPDGSMIVTYNQMPLYYWANDTQPGDTTGQGVGGVWFVVDPQGNPVGMEPVESPATQPAAAAEVEINVVNDPQYGDILVGNDGMTLYMFTRDEFDQSNCAGDCLVNWPPLVTEGDPVLGEGVNPELVGSAELADGAQIVTYNGMPLYYWVNDASAGDTTGQGVGGVWYVVSPLGIPIGLEAELNVAADPQLGEILVGNRGMTLYMFTRDEADKSNCTGECLVNWPPLLTEGSPTLGEGVDASLVGSAELADGSQIVTYNGMPLYYWIRDKQPGDTNGQGVGSVWFVVDPQGNPVGQ